MDVEINWDALNKVSIILAVILPVGTFFYFLVRKYWKQRKKIEHLEGIVAELENGLASKCGNLLFDAVVPNVEAAKAKIIEIINSGNETNKTLRIDNFGLDLETISSLFRYTFNSKSANRDIEYRGLVIDPYSENIKKVCGGNSNLCQETARRAILSLNDEDLKSDIELRVKLSSYDYPPVIHGFLIDDEHLMIGFTHFEAGGLVGGGTPYLYIKRDKSSQFKEGLFKAYKTWFDYWLTNGTRQIPSPSAESSPS